MIRAERQARVSPAYGWTLCLSILADAPALHPSMPLLPRAYALSSAHRIGIYDCLYAALAEREGCEFVTADDRLVRALQPHFPFMRALTTFP